MGIVVLLILLSCKKEQPITPQDPPPPWKKFVGTYQVYDTMGVYLHDMEVSHYSAVNQHGVEVDSLRLDNFNGMFDFGIQFQNISSKDILAIGIRNGLEDHFG